MADDAYERGHQDGVADGPENRPSEAWLRSEINPHREPLASDYLAGYDDGAAGHENRVAAAYAAEDERRRRFAEQELAKHELDGHDHDGPGAHDLGVHGRDDHGRDGHGVHGRGGHDGRDPVGQGLPSRGRPERPAGGASGDGLPF